MELGINDQVLLYLSGVILIFMVGRLFFTPVKGLLYLLVNGLLGFGALLLLHLFGSQWGLNVAINGVTLATGALLGLPGVGLLVRLLLLGF